MNINNEDEKNSTDGIQGMPPKPKLIMDEDTEEVTRRIAHTMITPSLRPLPAVPTGMAVNASPMKSSISQKQEHRRDSNLIPFSWKLSVVPLLPEFHPLERTATFVPNTGPAEIASRISDVLRERSIEAKYENDKAKVKCKTAEGVDFRIRLYRGRGVYNHGIIVEVQRRFGTSFVFHNDTQAILNGVKGEVTGLAGPKAKGNILPKVSDSDEEDDPDGTYAAPSAESALEMVAKMLKLACFDSQYLGLQMLSALVDSERLALSTARSVASKLFEQDCEVGEKVFGYIVKNCNKGKTNTVKRGVFDDDDDEDDDDSCDSSKILRNSSLSILANASKAYGKIPESLRVAIRPALLRDLYDAEKHPNTAFLSAKCLEFFIHDDHNKRELDNVFQVAYNVGRDRHANLMYQTERCIGINGAMLR